ncbi:hypothetical protein BgiMline_031289, partial [Biomphalaria glabrata]
IIGLLKTLVMNKWEHLLCLNVLSCLLDAVMSAGSQDNTSHNSAFTWPAVAFFVVLFLDLVVIVVLILVLKYKKSHATNNTYVPVLNRSNGDKEDFVYLNIQSDDSSTEQNAHQDGYKPVAQTEQDNP